MYLAPCSEHPAMYEVVELHASLRTMVAASDPSDG